MKELFTIIFSMTLLCGCDFYSENGTEIDGVVSKNGKQYKTIRKYRDKDDKIKESENKKEFENDYNMQDMRKLKKQFKDLKEQKDFYISEIKSDSTELLKLKDDSEERKKFARKKFLMKKDNEDNFIIRENEDE